VRVVRTRASLIESSRAPSLTRGGEGITRGRTRSIRLIYGCVSTCSRDKRTALLVTLADLLLSLALSRAGRGLLLLLLLGRRHVDLFRVGASVDGVGRRVRATVVGVARGVEEGAGRAKRSHACGGGRGEVGVFLAGGARLPRGPTVVRHDGVLLRRLREEHRCRTGGGGGGWDVGEGRWLKGGEERGENGESGRSGRRT
jgi:hypothetical protein